MKRITRPWDFFLLTFFWSWSLWLVPILSGFETPLSKGFFALAAIAPSAVGIILAYLKRDQEYWNDFLRRIFDYRQIALKWYLIIFLTIPLCNLLPVLYNYYLTGAVLKFTTIKYFINNPFEIISFIIFMLFFGPIVEELGWRGFALDHLEKRYSRFFSSIILSCFWASWHLPLFLIKGTYQNNILMDSFLYFIVFLVEFFPESIIMVWIYNNNGRSILSGILFHFAINFFGELINIPNYLKPFRAASLFVIAAAIMLNWRFRSYNKLDEASNMLAAKS